jgi:AcrR family transcriptional regulator
VVDTAAEEIERRGFAQLDLGVVSDRTGISRSAIVRYVGNVQEIGATLLEEAYPGLLVALERVPAGERDATALLEQHFTRFITLGRSRPAFADVDLALRLASVSRPSARRLAERQRLDQVVGALIAEAGLAEEPHGAPISDLSHRMCCVLALHDSASPPRVCAAATLAMVRSMAATPDVACGC